MIKYKEIEILITARNIERFRKLGYSVEYFKTLKIKTKDLNPDSHQKIVAVCEDCEKEQSVPYYKYLLNKSRAGLNKYTCRKCGREKAALTNLKLYGKRSYAQTEEHKIKVKNTSIERYGVDNHSSAPIVKVKRAKTMNERFGGNSALTNPIIKEKTKKTLMEKFGVECYSKSVEFKNVMRKHLKELYEIKLPKMFGLTDFILQNNNKIHAKCTEGCDHYFDVTYQLLKQRTIRYKVPICTICNPIGNLDGAEVQIIEYFKTLKIQNIIHNDKTILKPKHIDVLLPDLNFGIEYNGLYWHTGKYMENDHNYHRDKCINTKNKGIKLFHLFENYWKNNEDLIKNLLKSYLLKEYKPLNGDIVKIANKEIKKITNIFNYKLSVNTYAIKDNENIIGILSYNKNSVITYFYFEPNYDPRMIFDLFVKKLNLKNYFYKHDRNNVFLDIAGFKFVEDLKIDYKYFNSFNKKEYEVLNKSPINNKFKNNGINIIDNGYLKIYDCGYELYKIL